MLCVLGCSSLSRLEATRDAVDQGLVEGLCATNHFDAVPWSFPSKPLGPYRKLGGLIAHVTNGPNTNDAYVFFLGKSRETGKWEVFSSMVWRDGKWEPVPVKFPQSAK
jgi:hypothetical protein